MASKKGNKASRAVKSARAARGAVVSKKETPWGLFMAIAAVIVFAIGVVGWPVYEYQKKQEHERALSRWKPSETNKDPSKDIPGVVVKDYVPQRHVTADQRVAYDQSPPFGGPHDGIWAACTGTVYDQAVRNENMVHALEHGTVWIAYNPDRIKGADLDTLTKKVSGEEYMMISPYPTLDRPISLQSWGHQLKLDSATDERIDHFISALRVNRYQHPEPDGRCDAVPGGFDIDSPPPFIAEPPGAGAVPMDGGVDASATGGMNQTPGTSIPVPSPTPNAPTAVPPQGGSGPSPDRTAARQPAVASKSTQARSTRRTQPPTHDDAPPPPVVPTTTRPPGLLPLG